MDQDSYAANLLGALSLTLASRIEQCVADLGLRSQNAASALVTIRNHPDNTIEVLRRVLNLTHSGAGRLVTGLEEDGLIARGQDPEDSRAVVVRLTAKGRKQAQRVLESRAKQLKAATRILTSKQQADLIPIVEQILGVLTEDASGARRICRLCDEHVCRPIGCPVEAASIA
ncbi:MAG: MarR family winged helix-turn-helix transcriptional regulator [Planctomycetota bacterium]